VIGLCRTSGFEPRVVQEVEAWHTIISLVEAGIGVSLVPAWFQRHRTGALAYVPLTGAGSDVRTTTMACARTTGASRTAAAFLAILEAVCGAPAATDGRPGSRRMR
jgi:DNA-binding transcriptional LysR family regulator